MSTALEKLKKSLILFGRIIAPRMFYLKPAEFHFEIDRLLMNPANKLINLIAPRGTAKSTIVAEILPLHHIMFGEGTKVVVICSKTQGHAIDRLRSIKDILDYSEEFRQVFGYWGKHTAKVWAEDRVILKDGSAILTRGTGQLIRGVKIGEQRPTLIIVDDPEDETNTKTNEAMENNLRWLLQGAEPAKDAKRGRVVMIGTPLHQRCLVNVVKDLSRWVTAHYKYLNVDENGKEYSLWPEMYTVAQLHEMRDELDAVGRVSVFYKERQCEIIGDEDQLFRSDYIQYYEGSVEVKEDGAVLVENIGGIELRKPINLFMGVDPASSTKRTADFSVVMVVGMDSNNNRYVIEYFRKRVNPLVLADAILEMYYKYKPIKTRVESVGYQEMLRLYLREREYIPGLEIKEMPRNAKSSRIDGLQPMFAMGKVFVKKEHSEFVDELLIYPRGKHDDTLDGFYFATKNIYGPSEAVTERALPARKKSLDYDDGRKYDTEIPIGLDWMVL